MSAAVLNLVREDLRDFGGYASARRAGVNGSVWLNANESPWANPADAGGGLRRYPGPQPAPLIDALAGLYGASPEQVLAGRGSDEAIDLLVRALCRPGVDAVVIAPPTFGMYAVSARLQGAPLVEVPLREDGTGFRTDLDAMVEAALSNRARLVFLCSPSNPTGQAVGPDAIAAAARRLAGQALLVVDEAYVEYSEQPSVVPLLPDHPNLAVLRTLSKAHGLAAARIGTLLADPALVRLLRNCQAPYPLPAPCVDAALAALAPAALACTRERIALTRRLRDLLARRLARLPGVARVLPSQANFLLVRFHDAGAAFERLLAAGVVVRDMRAVAGLGDALRISIGSEDDNAAVIAALDPDGDA